MVVEQRIYSTGAAIPFNHHKLSVQRQTCDYKAIYREKSYCPNRILELGNLKTVIQNPVERFPLDAVLHNSIPCYRLQSVSKISKSRIIRIEIQVVYCDLDFQKGAHRSCRFVVSRGGSSPNLTIGRGIHGEKPPLDKGKV